MRIITLLLLLCAASLASAQPVVVFRDDFDDKNKNNWAQSNDADKSTSIADGIFTIKNNVKDTWWYFTTYIQIDPSQDYTVEAEITQTGGEPTSNFGLMYMLYDNKYSNTFIVNGNNQFNVYQYDDEAGGYKDISKYQTMTAIKPMGQPNKLAIKKTSSSVKYFVNDVEVYSVPSIEWFGNYFGIMANSKIELAVNYFEVRQSRKPEIKLVTGLTKGFKVENLGPNVNGPYGDISPLISADGKTLHFSRYSPENIGGDENTQDAYISRRNADGSWGKAENIGPPINNSNGNNIIGISADNNTALCMNTYGADGKMYGGFSISTRTSSGWTLPVEMKFDKYYNKSKYVGVGLSAGGNIIVIEREADTTYGGRDIYVSFKKPDGIWTEPMNLGPVVNSPANDMTPFLAADDKTLYFSTPGRITHGSNDVYLTRRLDDSWLNWSEPENLGPDVNTDDWDAYFTVPASGEYAYYSSQKNSLGKSDIVRVKLPDAAKPLPLFLVSGKTFNAKTKQPIEAKIMYESLPDGVAVGSLASRAGTGDYTISLARGKRYGFRAEKEGFFPVSDNLDATKLDKYTEVKKDLYLVPVEVGEVVRINNVFFDFAKYELRPESYPDLNRLASFLKTNASVEIQLLGHTDNVGKDGDNIKLSENRIQSVKSYLVSQGIDAVRMSAKGYGKSKPIAANDTEEGRQQNRRVEFTIVKK